jgi:hypothetical protein
MRSRQVQVRAGAAAALLALLAGCGETPAEPPMTAWQATLEPTGSRFGPAGSLGAVSEGFNTRLSLQIEFGDPAAAYGWRVRTGSCTSSSAAQLGGDAAYPNAVANEEGQASVSGTIAVRLESRERYHVVITAPGDENVTLACGALERLTA